MAEGLIGLTALARAVPIDALTTKSAATGTIDNKPSHVFSTYVRFLDFRGAMPDGTDGNFVWTVFHASVQLSQHLPQAGSGCNGRLALEGSAAGKKDIGGLGSGIWRLLGLMLSSLLSGCALVLDSRS